MIRLLVSVTAAMHCKKRLAVFLSPAGMSPTKLSLTPPPPPSYSACTGSGGEGGGVEVEPNYKTTKKPVIFFSYSCSLPLPVIHTHFVKYSLYCFNPCPCPTATNGIEEIRIQTKSAIYFFSIPGIKKSCTSAVNYSIAAGSFYLFLKFRAVI
jgi:hypothetical protein